MGLLKKITNSAKNWATSPIKGAKAALNGDVMGVLNAATNFYTYGTVSLTDGSGGFIDSSKAFGDLTGTNATANAIANAQALQEAQEKAAADALAKQQEEAKSAAISRRRADLTGNTKTIYTSALGDAVNTVAGKKKTVLGG